MSALTEEEQDILDKIEWKVDNQETLSLAEVRFLVHLIDCLKDQIEDMGKETR